MYELIACDARLVLHVKLEPIANAPKQTETVNSFRTKYVLLGTDFSFQLQKVDNLVGCTQQNSNITNEQMKNISDEIRKNQIGYQTLLANLESVKTVHDVYQETMIDATISQLSNVFTHAQVKASDNMFSVMERNRFDQIQSNLDGHNDKSLSRFTPKKIINSVDDLLDVIIANLLNTE